MCWKYTFQEDDGEKIKFLTSQHQPQVERFYAKITRTDFATHTHEGFVIGIVHAGRQRFTHWGTAYEVGAGSLIMINPEDLHSTSASGDSGVHYETLHVPAEMLNEVTPKGYRFTQPLLFTPSMSANVARRLRYLDSADDEILWRNALSELLYDVGHMKGGDVESPPYIGDKRLLRIFEYIDGNISEPLKLEELASIAGISKYHLIRLFKAKTGVTPHVYVQARRAIAAKRLLKIHPPSIAAALAGFVDQSHLTKWMKSCYGTTPSVLFRRFRRFDGNHNI